MRTTVLTRIFGAAALLTALVAAPSAVLLGGAGPAAAWETGPTPYDCTGGNIPAGTYSSMDISGVCFMTAGNVVVKGNLTVKPGALLDNNTPGDPSGSPVVAAQLYVGGDMRIGRGAVALLGCSPNSSCANPPGISSADIRGNLTANQPLGVVIHSSSIGGNFTVVGGGGNPTCDPSAAPAPWSEDASNAGTPVYTDVEDASIGGNYTIVGQSSCWLGSLRNQIGGDATFIGNKMGDPDAMEIGNNLVHQDLTCFNNDPAPQFGDGASSDLVGGRARGQCAFDVVLQNPAAEAITANGGSGVGIEQHFAVSLRHLKTYTGTHTDTPLGPPVESVTTDAGHTVVAQLYDFTLAGKGLVGTGTYNGGPPGQSPGEAVLATVFKNGSESFTAFDICDKCSFAGQDGSVMLRAYGNTDRRGFTSGTFLITSSGTVLSSPSSPIPGLATLVGYGSFWGSGATLHVIEHLGFG